uniref:Mitochondrial assembly of ribosomal large subunit protein 1 n=1 Tax=Daphnia sinensis TaxID=1820382 RepID=A0A4Y7NBZ0_9CRUS|nr:EOG090X0AI9 [Daphnia sinensis]
MKLIGECVLVTNEEEVTSITFTGSLLLEDVNELTKLVATAEANWEKNDILKGTSDFSLSFFWFKFQNTVNSKCLFKFCRFDSERQYHSTILLEENWQRIGDSETVEEFDEFQGISLQRGTTGIFDIEEFVEILNNQKLQDIVVIAVPSQLNYVDYMVITTGKSPKQMTAVAEFIRKLSKRRCLTTDPLPVIEGKNNKDWIALDLGNIALHIFSSKVRKIYDLETLWTCGPDFDDLSIEKDTLTSPMNCYTFPSQKSV